MSSRAIALRFLLANSLTLLFAAAWAAGLRSGDVVVSFGGERVSTARQLIGMIRESQVGRQVEVEAFSNEERVTFTVTIGERPDG